MKSNFELKEKKMKICLDKSPNKIFDSITNCSPFAPEILQHATIFDSTTKYAIILYEYITIYEVKK